MGTVSQLAEQRELSSDKAERIVEAMRASVATRGFSASTFEHVAREAGVSRGLLHYYFGTKERLLVEVVRRECEVRKQRLIEAVAGAGAGNEVLQALVSTFQDFLGEGPTSTVMFYEMITLAQQNEQIAAGMADLGLRTRTQLAEELAKKVQAGDVVLTTDPDAAAQFLFALADGVTMRRLVEPELDIRPLMKLAVAAAGAVFG
jgi:AcrR family transcriptional regulator